MRDFSQYEPFLAMLEFGTDISPIEAEKRAEKCFHVQSWIIRDLHKAEYAELIVGDNVEMVKSELLLQVPATFTNDASRKAWVQTRPARREVFEKYATSKADLDQLRRMLRLFEGAQIYYGAKARR